jgi:hypothetical protein
MRTRVRHGLRLAVVMAVGVAPVLTGSDPSALLDGGPQTTAARSDVLQPAFPEADTVRTPLPPPQHVEPQTTLVAKKDRNKKIRLEGPRGSRVWTASSLASHDLPSAALEAYKGAAASMASADPSCQMPWTLLAGIGRVESDHGRYGGSVLSTDGVSRPAIIGVALNGVGPVAAIRDTDNGKLDRDEVWDRAVGPMQFIPSTWAYSGRDGDGDGDENPHDLDDAALAAASYLCSGSGSMLDDASAKAAIFRYNPSDYYVALVQAFERGYRTGVFVMPSPPPPAGQDDAKRKKRRHDDSGTTTKRDTRDGRDTSGSSQPKQDDSPAPKPAPKPTPKPSPSPTPKPSPSPSPTPSAPTLVALSGQLSACGTGWCAGGKGLDLGPSGQLGAKAAHDYDGNGTVGTNIEEFTGLAGQQVTVQVDSGTTTVYVFDGKPYRNADGSFV